MKERQRTYFQQICRMTEDPYPFLAIYLDRSIPFDEEAKAAYLRDCSRIAGNFCCPCLAFRAAV